MRTPLIPGRQLALLVAGLAVVGSFAPANAQTAQPPRPQSQATKVAPAEDERVTIVGRVTMADTGAPVRRARVWAEIAGASMGSVLTDGQGRYLLKGLPHERCRVVASKAPFVTMRHGQRYPNGPDTEVDLTSVSTASRVDIALWRGGVIAGRLYDDLGEPVAETQVAALRVRMNAGTRRLESTGRVVTTDDLGQYRLAGLPTGTYLVATVPARDGSRLAPSYFPGTQDVKAAIRISVRTGAEQGGTDFVVGFTPSATARGTVVGESGVRVPASVYLTNGFDTATAAAPDGTFELRNVAPGPYELTAIRMANSGGLWMSSAAISIDGDVDDIVLRLGRGGTLRGVVTTDDGTHPPFDAGQVTLGLTPVPGTAFTLGPSSTVVLRADWTFEVPGVDGALQMKPRALPDGWMLERVLAGSDDVTDVGVLVTTGEGVDDVRVVLTNRVTEIAGVVLDAKQTPVGSCVIVVFSDDSFQWGPQSRFVAKAAPDNAGHFTLKRLPSGTYRAVALEFLEEGAEEDPEMLASLRERALKFDLGKGESLKLSLPLTRVK
jgi:hypothetical protein